MTNPDSKYEIGIDWASQPSIEITTTYERATGRHLSTIMRTDDGMIVWEEGPNPAKDVTMFFKGKWPWDVSE